MFGVSLMFYDGVFLFIDLNVLGLFCLSCGVGLIFSLMSVGLFGLYLLI